MIKEITDKRQKKRICADILHSLPEFFAIEKSIKDLAKGCMDKAMWADIDGEDVRGFISLSETNKYTADIYVMGVKKEFHRQGIGKMLFKEFERFAAGRYDYLQAKTNADGCLTNCDVTKFYRSVGFRELEAAKRSFGTDSYSRIFIKFIGGMA